MDEQDVRVRAEALCAALVAGDVDKVIANFSEELHHNLGEVLALLLLPSSEATIEAIDHGAGSGFVVVLRLRGPAEEVQIQTRWKDRDDRPTVIELSHLSRTELTAQAVDEGEATDGEAAESN